MKRGIQSNSSQPIVRILLVAPHLYQVSLRNIYGYLKTILLDRCKKVGAQYLHYERSYFIDSQKLGDLKKQFEEVLSMKSTENNTKFRIEEFPMTNIKMIMRSDKKTDNKLREKNRIIFIDKFSVNRYFYVRKRIQDFYCDLKKNADKKQRKITLILTSEINRKFWLTNVLQPKKVSGPQENILLQARSQFPQVVELTYSQLSGKRYTSYQSLKQANLTELNKIYLVTYDNLRFVENSWFLGQVQAVSMIIVDDAEFLVSSECQISTLENKKRNFEAFRLLLKNYPIDQELCIFLSKLPEPLDLFRLLVLTKPKHFSGIRFSTTLNSSVFNESLFTPQEKCMYDEFCGWFRKRYRSENRCFKQIYYLMRNVVIKRLDESIFKKQPGLLPAIELSENFGDNISITVLESSSEIVQKFRVMDKKYKKQCPSINFKQILEEFHDPNKSDQKKFQITSKLDDHVKNKNAKNYFNEAKQLMLNSKFELILKRLFYFISSKKERICVVLEDQKLEKRLKKYFKQTQIEYIDYELKKENKQTTNTIINTFMNNSKQSTFYQFDQNYSIKACIVNIARVHKQFLQLQKSNKKAIQKQFNHPFQFHYNHHQYQDPYQLIKIPKLTTPQSIHHIDSFWNQFSFQKEKLLYQIFNFKLSYIEQSIKEGQIQFKEVFKVNRITENYFLFDGSYEKMMLQKYLTRRQQLSSFKVQQHIKPEQKLQTFINTLFTSQKVMKFKQNCEVIEYLDIDDEYDKIEQEAKQLKNNKDLNAIEEKVFLPKYTKPQCKSFKEILQQKLMQKNINDILQEEDMLQDDIQKSQKRQDDIQVTQKVQQLIQNSNKKQPDHNIFAQINEDKTVKQTNTQSQNNPKQQKQENQTQISNVFPQFQIQTPKLQDILPKQPSIINSNILQNEKEKDLFDVLLGQNYQFDYHNQQNYKIKQPQLEEIQTSSEYDNESKRKIKSWSIKQQETQQDLLLQNFGYLAYHNIKSTQPKISSEKLPNTLKTKILSQEQKDDSIQIIQMTPRRVQAHSTTKINQKPIRVRPSKILSKKIKPRPSNIPFYQLPKEKRLCNKKLYQEAISKSKQLWEKKLRKQKELLILKSEKLSITLKPKQSWKQSLTELEKQRLRMKGIKI